MPRLVDGELYVKEATGGGRVKWRKAGILDRLFGEAVERHRDCSSGRWLPLSERTTGCGPRVCYASRAELARALATWLSDRYGADLDNADSKGFDSVNERHELRGRRKVRTLRAACVAVCPSSAPWCLDRVDMATLNETTPAREAGGYDLPDAVYERRALLAQVEAAGDADDGAAPF